MMQELMLGKAAFTPAKTQDDHSKATDDEWIEHMIRRLIAQEQEARADWAGLLY